MERFESKIVEQDRIIDAYKCDSKSLNEQLSKQTKTHLEEIKDLKSASSDIEQLQLTIQSLENDRDYSKNEYNELSRQFKNESNLSIQSSTRIERLETALEQMKDDYDVAQRERKSLLDEVRPLLLRGDFAAC
eukprot:TRINITY_DN12910_c0_g1_i1.p1 TRINITY_DN12910_c0_g1~~TRINITY_DN12910_c0_g1_i1.p1  ORF type:complete len:133 (+),score=28.08 TRINITY_DN12910_c0_g1_i1:165-563(+)